MSPCLLVLSLVLDFGDRAVNKVTILLQEDGNMKDWRNLLSFLTKNPSGLNPSPKYFQNSSEEASPLHTQQDGYNFLKRLIITSVGENVEKSEHTPLART